MASCSDESFHASWANAGGLMASNPAKGRAANSSFLRLGRISSPFLACPLREKHRSRAKVVVLVLVISSPSSLALPQLAQRYRRDNVMHPCVGANDRTHVVVKTPLPRLRRYRSLYTY